MYAIVDIAGQQIKVEKGQKVVVNRLQGDKGSQVDFDQVMLIADGDKTAVGDPVINGAQVTATIVDHIKGDKVFVFKKKRRKGFKKLNGHRQYLSLLEIVEILEKGAKPKKEASKSAKKEETKAKTDKPAKEEAKPKAKAVKEDKPEAEVKKPAPKAKPAEKKEAKAKPTPKAKTEEKKETKSKAPKAETEDKKETKPPAAEKKAEDKKSKEKPTPKKKEADEQEDSSEK